MRLRKFIGSTQVRKVSRLRSNLAKKDERMSELKIKERERVTVEPLTVPLWPHAGMALGLTRNGTYEAAKRGDIPVLQFGKLKRVSKKWLGTV